MSVQDRRVGHNSAVHNERVHLLAETTQLPAENNRAEMVIRITAESTESTVRHSSGVYAQSCLCYG